MDEKCKSASYRCGGLLGLTAYRIAGSGRAYIAGLEEARDQCVQCRGYYYVDRGAFYGTCNKVGPDIEISPTDLRIECTSVKVKLFT